ncbi:PREDICTED: microtubule-associated protein RP/EB family member 1-like [Nelumbo nucifera]|uniref:Microtubule-associated protein RP/EB family member 1-like n=1 Tax=Nelumbo nucifera TaxID=4432 RepID=A0A1U8B0K3_NELNU|nr:PREDICTED: microtubule-associated protein RP/EB family member 1-like [Nelumbo nucifera]
MKRYKYWFGEKQKDAKLKPQKNLRYQIQAYMPTLKSHFCQTTNHHSSSESSNRNMAEQPSRKKLRFRLSSANKASAPPQPPVQPPLPTPRPPPRSESQSPSPSHLAPPSKAPSPSYTTRPRIGSQPQSPSRTLSKPLTRTSSQNPSPSTTRQSLPSQPQSPSTYQTSQAKTPPKPKSGSSVVTSTLTQPPRSEKMEGEKHKPIPETRKQEKLKGLATSHQEPAERTITEVRRNKASGSMTKMKEQSGIASQTEHMQLNKQIFLDGKKTTVTGSKGRESKEQLPPSFTVSHHEQQPPLDKEIKGLEVGNPKEPIDENKVAVITLAGENRGAAMHIGTESAKREESIHIHRSYKLNQEGHQVEGTTEDEGSAEASNLDDSKTEGRSPAMFINSNTQSINNSLLLDSCFSERSPGAHLVVSQKAMDAINLNTGAAHLEEDKANLNTAPQPVVRRRCLRALFMESSDSDPDNPNKPRRHGCRYNCGESKVGKENGQSSLTK